MERPKPQYCVDCESCITLQGYGTTEYSCDAFRHIVTSKPEQCEKMRTGNICPAYVRIGG